MELNCKKALMILNDCKGMAKNDDWFYIQFVLVILQGYCKTLNLDEDYAKTLGYIHDIGKSWIV